MSARHRFVTLAGLAGGIAVMAGCASPPPRPAVARGALIVRNAAWKEWINCSGSTNGDVTVVVDGYTQGFAANGSFYRMALAAGRHTVTISRKPGDYCWQDPVSCEITIGPRATVTVTVTGLQRLACP